MRSEDVRPEAASPRIVTHLLLPPSPELDRLVEHAFDRIERTLPYDRLAFCRASARDEVEITAVRQEGESHTPPGTRIRYAEALGADVVMSGLAIVIEPGRSPLAFDRKVAAAGIRHVLRVPVGREGSTAGAITVSRRAGEFSEDEVAAVTRIADEIADAILALAADADEQRPAAG